MERIPQHVVTGFSDSLVLRGVDKQCGKARVCNVVLEVGTKCQISTSTSSRTIKTKTSIPLQEQHFSHSLHVLGLGVEDACSNAGFSENNDYLGLWKTNLCYLGNHTTVSVGNLYLDKDALRLSKTAISELKKLEWLLLKNEDEQTVQNCCESFFKLYGSHVLVGNVQFGGRYSVEGRYSGKFEFDEKVEHIVQEAINSHNSYHTQPCAEDDTCDWEVKVSIHTRGGPKDVDSLESWEKGLHADLTKLTITEREQRYFGIWDVLKNHREIENVDAMCSMLCAAWERRQGQHSEKSGKDTKTSDPIVEKNPKMPRVLELEANAGKRLLLHPDGRVQSEIDTNNRIHEEGNCSFAIQEQQEVDSSGEESEESSAERSTSKVELLKKLNLTDYHPEKISLQTVLRKGESNSDICLENVPWTMLWKLVTLDRKGISTVVQEDISQKQNFENVPGIRPETDCDHHPLDIFLTTFACCDLNLRQILVEKMFQCRLAVPFILPGIDSDQLTYCLWALRSIVPIWRNDKDEAVELSLPSQNVHVVSFLRLKETDFSKSIFLNNVMSDEERSSFYNQDCPNGDVKKVLSNGLIEASFFLPNGKETDNLDHLTMYLNLRGDGTQLDKQVSVLSKLSTILIVCLDISNLNEEDVVRSMTIIHNTKCNVILVLTNKENKSPKKVQDARKKHASIYPEAYTNCVKTVFAYEASKGKKCTGKNVSKLKHETRKLLKDMIAEQRGSLLTDSAGAMREEQILIDEDNEACKLGMYLADSAGAMREEQILIDEDNEACKQGMSLADGVLSFLGNFPSKSNLLPLQGHDWKEWCRLLKEKNRTMDGLTKVGIIEEKMKEHRKKQAMICKNLNPLVDGFIAGIKECIDTPAIDFYLQWLHMHLNDISREKLPSLQKSYFIELNKSKHTSKKKRTNPSEKTELEEAEDMLADAMFGLEHLLRELGQIYEGSANMSCRKRFEHLPRYAAQLLLKGYSLEIMDGDSSGVPLIWLKAVFSSLEALMEEKKKLFCLSVLGVQSSGKSTLLNTMFGLQFPVSAGRCTRGVYMQLIKVPDGHDLPIDYVVVLDTEGLRAPERGESYIDHDNELATFVTGLGNVTVMNIKGENVSDIKDVLQIVSHAFLRLQMVDKCLNKDRSCIFVHQNVPATDAKEKMAVGTHKFEETLDEMTAEAADLENMAGIRTFRQVINFDREKDVFYIPGLWLGNPPMASINPFYREEVKMVRKSVMNISSGKDCSRNVPEMFDFIKDFWNGVLQENFVFGFKNAVVTRAYNSLEKKYTQLKWDLENNIIEWLADFNIKKYETQDGLDIACSSYRAKTESHVKTKVAELIKQLCKFIENDPKRKLMDDWRVVKCIALQHAAEACERNAQLEIGKMKKKQEVCIIKRLQQMPIKRQIVITARKLAGKLQGSNKDVLASEFKSFWDEWSVDLAGPDPNTDFVIEYVLGQELHEHFKVSQYTLLSKMLEESPLTKHTIVRTLVKSIKPEDISDDELSMRKSKVWHMKKPVKLKHKKAAALIIDNIFDVIQTFLQIVNKGTSGFQIQDARRIIKTIRELVETHNSKNADKFSIPVNFEIRILVHAMRYALGVFLKVQDNYNKLYSPSAQLKDYRNNTWNLFKQMAEQAEQEVIIANTLCKVLEQPVLDSVKGKLQRAISDSMVPCFYTKKKVIKSILEDLAEQEQYDEYRSYIFQPKAFATKWLVRFIDDFAFSTTSGENWYVGQAEHFLDDILTAIQTGMKKAIQMTRTCKQDQMRYLTEVFSDEISRTIVFSIAEYQPIFDKDVTDLSNLEREFCKQSEEIFDEILADFRQETRETVQWDGKTPYDVVMESVWGCDATCPFCREPCQKSDPDHASETDCHECIQHRPQSVSGWRWTETKLLILENCSYNVHGDSTFRCRDTDHECDGKEQPSYEGDVYHPYSQYKTYLPNWEILASSDMNSSHYWLWYTSTFQKEIEKDNQKEMSEIPQYWKTITKAEAIASLDMYGM